MQNNIVNINRIITIHWILSLKNSVKRRKQSHLKCGAVLKARTYRT